MAGKMLHEEWGNGGMRRGLLLRILPVASACSLGGQAVQALLKVRIEGLRVEHPRVRMAAFPALSQPPSGGCVLKPPVSDSERA